jgi:hypothetical protein
MMRKTAIVLALVTFALTPVFSDGQFRIAGNASTPLQTIPEGGPEAWYAAVVPDDTTMTGWYWEVIFNRVGLGMHYGVRFYEPVAPTPESELWYMDWKGDFFLSYHLFGGGSVLDPFVEFGWGNVGSTVVTSPVYVDCPDWEDEVDSGDALALSFYNYVAAGLALDLNGLLLGAKLSYVPTELLQTVPDSSVAKYALQPFEVSFFGGFALGGHRHHHHRDRDWDWD